MYKDNENWGSQLECCVCFPCEWLDVPLEIRNFLETAKVIHDFVNIFKYSLMYSNFFEEQ